MLGLSRLSQRLVLPFRQARLRDESSIRQTLLLQSWGGLLTTSVMLMLQISLRRSSILQTFVNVVALLVALVSLHRSSLSTPYILQEWHLVTSSWPLVGLVRVRRGSLPILPVRHGNRALSL